MELVGWIVSGGSYKAVRGEHTLVELCDKNIQ